MSAYNPNAPNSPTIGHFINDRILDRLTSPESSSDQPEGTTNLAPKKYEMDRGARKQESSERLRNAAHQVLDSRQGGLCRNGESNGSTPASEPESLDELQARNTADLADIAATMQDWDRRETAWQTAARREPQPNDIPPNNPDPKLPDTPQANSLPRTPASIIAGRRSRAAASSPPVDLSDIEPYCGALLRQARSISLEQGRREGFSDDEIQMFHAFPALQVWMDPALITSISEDTRQRLMYRVERELMLIDHGAYARFYEQQEMGNNSPE
jgi:hypothetical protein